MKGCRPILYDRGTDEFSSIDNDSWRTRGVEWNRIGRHLQREGLDVLRRDFDGPFIDDLRVDLGPFPVLLKSIRSDPMHRRITQRVCYQANLRGNLGPAFL